MSEESFRPILEFDTDESEFARGFEAGRLWGFLLDHDSDQLDGQPFHATNVEMVLRMLDATGHDGVTAEFSDDPGWMVLRSE